MRDLGHLIGFRRLFVPAILAALAALHAREAGAGVVYYSSEGDFQALGTIGNRTDFSGASGIIGQGTRFGDLIADTSPYLAVVGGANGAKLVVQPTYTTVQFAVDSTTTEYSMLGFRVGFVNPLGRAGSAAITITTNLKTYTLGNYSAPAAGQSLAFHGFATDQAGEYITAFQVLGNYDFTGGGAGVTDIQLGVIAASSAVPEPSGLILAAAGVLALPWFARRRPSRP